MTAVLAMLYLTLMASLALGFYSATNTAAIVSDNEQKVERTRLAAESGLDSARFNLSKVLIPAKALITQHFSLLCDQMSARLNGSGNLDNGSIYADGISTIRVPADTAKFVKADGQGSEFQFTITNLGDRKVRVTSTGHNTYASASTGIRTVRLDFELQQKPSTIFQYGIATRGTVSTSGSTSLLGQPNPDKGSVLSVNSSDPTPVKIGGKEISGDISVVNPNANVVVSGGSVGGSTSASDIQANHVHKGVDDPEFPTLDTSMFIPYATNMYTPGKGTYSNIIIPPNTNPSQGVIVTDTTGQVGNLNTNTVSFQGGFDAKGVETLDPSYGDLRNLSGSFMIMPGFSLSFAGNFNATAYGTIVVDKASMTGSAIITLHGSLIIMSDTPMTMQGNSQLTAGDNALAFPAGLRFSNYYVAIPSTYDEVKSN